MFRSLTLKTNFRRTVAAADAPVTPTPASRAAQHQPVSRNQADDFAQPDTVTMIHVQGRVPVTLLRIHGRLNGDTYESVIEQGEQLVQAGVHSVLVDLCDVTTLSTAGLVALHNLARFINGQPRTNTEDGWSAIHLMAADRDGGLPVRLKLACPQPGVMRVLEQAGMAAFFDIYDDHQRAIQSF